MVLDDDFASPSIQSLKPNPFTTDFTVEFLTTTEEPVTINVYDIYGKLFFRQKTIGQVSGLNAFSIIGAEWETGIYLVEIITADQRVLTKAVKVK